MGYSGDNGPASLAQLQFPEGIAVDGAGNVYVADTQNNVVRKISNGVITTITGNGTLGFSGGNGPALDAELFYPLGNHREPTTAGLQAVRPHLDSTITQ